MNRPGPTPDDSGAALPVRRHPIDLTEASAVARTVADLVRIGVSVFSAAELSYGHGTDNAYDESVALVLWALHLPPDTPDTLFSCQVTASETACVIHAIERRVQTRAPLGYVTGETWFRGLRFLTDPRALIPRSPLVEALQESLPQWLDSHLPHWIDQRRPARILDLCTGGGSIAIHAAHLFPDALITAVDLDADALDLCRQNIQLHHLGDRISPVCSDLFARLAGSEQFDLIVCNPPYVPSASMDRLPAEYRREPTIALAAGGDGMQIIRQILAHAPARLTDEGILILEIGHEIDAFIAAFPDLAFASLPVAAGDQMILLIEKMQLAEAQNR